MGVARRASMLFGIVARLARIHAWTGAVGTWVALASRRYWSLIALAAFAVSSFVVATEPWISHIDHAQEVVIIEHGAVAVGPFGEAKPCAGFEFPQGFSDTAVDWSERLVVVIGKAGLDTQTWAWSLDSGAVTLVDRGHPDTAWHADARAGQIYLEKYRKSTGQCILRHGELGKALDEKVLPKGCGGSFSATSNGVLVTDDDWLIWEVPVRGEPAKLGRGRLPTMSASGRLAYFSTNHHLVVDGVFTGFVEWRPIFLEWSEDEKSIMVTKRGVSRPSRATLRCALGPCSETLILDLATMTTRRAAAASLSPKVLLVEHPAMCPRIKEIDPYARPVHL